MNLKIWQKLSLMVVLLMTASSIPVVFYLYSSSIGLSADKSQLILGSAVAAVAVAILLVFFVAGGIYQQIESIRNVFESINQGKYNVRAEVTSGDEIGSIASSLNSMLDGTLNLVQTREQHDSIQKSIIKLLEEVSGVAEGDLTKEAEVTADITGAIADSFNYMITELRRVIGDVQEATLHVSSASDEMLKTMDHLSNGSETQTVQIIDTTAAIDEMLISIKQVSENAAMSSVVADEALKNAKQGTQAVEKTKHGMNSIRDQVQETAKRIKRLGESSQEVGEIVQLIGDIADRTSILALNASIQAAMAGEAGRGFAVVAEEVERLAERATESTKRIATLVKTIQTETNEAVSAMEDTTREVVSGSSIANEAAKALEQIEQVSNKMAELVQSITMAAKQQARGSEAIAEAMTEISKVTQQTAAGTRQASVSISNLTLLADNLRGSVKTFKLPESNGHEAVFADDGKTLYTDRKGNGNGISALQGS